MDSPPEQAIVPADDLLGQLGERVLTYRQRVRHFFYEVVLWGHACPQCSGELVMVKEGRCCCTVCGMECDPTVAFQRCPECEGVPQVRIRRYECSRCGLEVVSRFLFDGLVFDADYFRQKMAESRQRRQQDRHDLAAWVAHHRSQDLEPGPIELSAVPGLADALAALVDLPVPEVTTFEPARFDLLRYEQHVLAHAGSAAVPLDNIPALEDDSRRDRIWRFIAVVFLWHAGQVDVRQCGPTIEVIKCETDRKRQAVPAGTQATDGTEASVG
jgi:hypothetical protein